MLSNVVRHSGASQALVEVVVVGDVFCVEVVDDGVGLRPDIVLGDPVDGRVGVASHRARIEAAGGTFAVLDPPRGTHIRVEIPVVHPWSGR